MGLETQAVVNAHLDIAQLSDLVRGACGIVNVMQHNTHQPDYKIMEFMDKNGFPVSLDVFLNSYAAEDYSDIFTGNSTLLTTPLTPASTGMLLDIVAGIGGFVRQHSGVEWQPVADSTHA